MSTCGGIRPRYLSKWDCSIRRNYQWQASSKRESCCALHDERKISNHLLQLSRRREHLGLIDESKLTAGRVRRSEFNGCEQPCYQPRPWVVSFSLCAENVQH